VPWVETTSLSFTARHEASHEADAEEVLEALEEHRNALEALFPRIPGNVTVVLHDSSVQLGLAQPYLPVARRLASPPARRYMAGWFAPGEVHVLAPRVLRHAAAGQDSLDALKRTPQRAYTLLVVGENNPALPPPFRPGSISRMLRNAWLAEGAAQHFSGQVPFLRPAIATRLRRGRVDCPPSQRDTGILAGALFDLLERDRGPEACVRLACQPLTSGSAAALEQAFEQPASEVARRYRAHLERLAAPAPAPTLATPS
jgi:hypothetical protein